MKLQELEEARNQLDRLPPSPENWHARLPLLRRLDELFSCPELENDPALNRFYHEVCRRVIAEIRTWRGPGVRLWKLYSSAVLVKEESGRVTGFDLNEGCTPAGERRTRLQLSPGLVEEFAELEAFVKEFRFERCGVFPYSPEPNTPAAALPDQIPVEVANARARKLMRLQRTVMRQANRRWIGREVRMLVDEIDGRTAVGRASMGVRIMDLRKGDKVTGATIVVEVEANENPTAGDEENVMVAAGVDQIPFGKKDDDFEEMEVPPEDVNGDANTDVPNEADETKTEE